MQFPLSELRRSASARLDGRSREDRGQTMRLCHLWKGILSDGHESYKNVISGNKEAQISPSESTVMAF